MENHVHDCTGPGMKCPCGYQFKVTRFQVEISIWDNQEKRALVNEVFGCDSIGVAIDALHEAAEAAQDA